MSMCAILLSIKPEYVKEILKGTKKFEFRRRLAKRAVNTIIIYATSPEKRIVAEVEVLSTVSDSIDRVWEITSEAAGITQETFFDYFSGLSYANAYKLGVVKTYGQPMGLEDYGLKVAPQSFCYIER